MLPVQGAQIWSLVRELFRELEKEMATHSSVLAWRIPGTGGAWRATVRGVTKSWTWLKRLSTQACKTKEPGILFQPTLVWRHLVNCNPILALTPWSSCRPHPVGTQFSGKLLSLQLQGTLWGFLSHPHFWPAGYESRRFPHSPQFW